VTAESTGGGANAGLLLGVDSGQTVGKVGLYDVAGREVASASARTATCTPHPRWMERDMEQAWQQLAGAIRTVLTQVGPDVAIRGVGICGHNDGAYPVDAGLAPVRPAILATDSRAHGYSARIGAGEVGRRALELTGQVPFAASPASVYAWLRDAEPDRYAAVRWALFCKDWFRLRLTGEVGTDPTDASASFVGVRDRQWSTEALELFGLADLRPAMPPMLASAAVAGAVNADGAALTGLPIGTPVVTGAHDVDAAALGIGAIGSGAASIVLGTFSINQVVADRPVADPRWQARAFLVPGRWLHMSTSPAGAVNLDWAIRRLGPLRPDGEPATGAAVVEAMTASGVDAPLFLPFLYGSPHGDTAGASWLGLRGWHGRAELLHAVLEGVAFNHRTHLRGLQEAFAIERPVRVCGGGARSADWTQLLADVLDLPIEVTDATESGTRGAAMLAGIGTGVYADLEDAVGRTVHVVRSQQPRADQVSYRASRYGRYLAAAVEASA
jgi:L-xylulokinase